MKPRCPFADDPFDDCYVVKMDSMDIEKSIYYCAGDYEECEIYRKSAAGLINKNYRGENHTDSTGEGVKL